MFERYTEKARRVIFFARYEASQYGSRVIDTEHILLGLLREDRPLLHRCVGPIESRTEIRTEVERVIQRGAPISTSAEVPLSGDSKKILTFAVEEAERLGHRHIGTEHVLLGIFRLPDSLAAKILLARGAHPDAIRERIAKGSFPPVATAPPVTDALTTVHAFLGGLQEGAFDNLPDFFHNHGQFIDSSGKRWLGRAEIAKGAEALLAPFVKRSARVRLEDSSEGPPQTYVASLLWEFAAASSDRSKSMLRMSIVLTWADQQWAIVLLQVTPVAFS